MIRWLPVLQLVFALTASALAQPATDPEAELIVAMPDDTTNMDPRIGMGSIRSTYIRQVFESLVDVDPHGKPVPGLALAWKPVGDTAWEFSLRRGVKFHDGEAFNADTVLFNLDRMFRRNLDKHGIGRRLGKGGRGDGEDERQHEQPADHHGLLIYRPCDRSRVAPLHTAIVELVNAGLRPGRCIKPETLLVCR